MHSYALPPSGGCANSPPASAASFPGTPSTRGFFHAGEQVHLATRPKGIFWPRQMRRGVLSIRTTVPRQGRERRYEDIASDDGYFEYRFRGEDAQHGDNRALRESWEDQSPLVYFHAVVPTLYQAIWPAFITDWDAAHLCVRVVAGEQVRGESVLPASSDTRRYLVVEAKRRLH